MNREKRIDLMCEDCPHKQLLHKYGNKTKEVYCNHPDKRHIIAYFEQNKIKKFPSFIGFINAKGDFPVKKAPKWCPLRSKGGEEE